MGWRTACLYVPAVMRRFFCEWALRRDKVASTHYVRNQDILHHQRHRLVLFLQLPPAQVDVTCTQPNSEVRFREARPFINLFSTPCNKHLPFGPNLSVPAQQHQALCRYNSTSGCMCAIRQPYRLGWLTPKHRSLTLWRKNARK